MFTFMQKKEECSPELWATPIAILIAGVMITSAIAMHDGPKGKSMYAMKEKAQPEVVEDVVNPTAAAVDPLESTAAKNILKVTKDDHVRGAKKPKVTIIEYSDMECPFCGRFHETMKQVIDQRDDVQWVYRHFPLAFHKNAAKAAEAGECVADVAGEDAFWAYSDGVFSAGSLAGEGIMNFVRTLSGVNADKVASCLDSGKYTDLVAQQTRDAQKLGGTGTPWSIMIGADGKAQPIRGARQLTSMITDIEKASKK